MTSKSYTLRPIGELGDAARLWLGINLGCEVLRLIQAIVDLVLVANLRSLTGEQLDLWSQVSTASMILVVPYYICLVVVGVWIYRASTNAHALGKGLRISPPWSVGWFAIPFASLWKPYESMSETWRVSHDPDGWRRNRSPDSMRIWWGAWLTALISGNLGNRLLAMFSDIGVLVFADLLLLVSASAGIVASIYLRRLIAEVNARQTDHLHTRVF